MNCDEGNMLYSLLCVMFKYKFHFPMQNGVLGLGCPQPPAITIGNPNPTVTTTATPPPATGGPGATQPTPPGGGTGVGPCRIVILPTLQVAPGPQCRVLHIPGFPNCAIGLGSILISQDLPNTVRRKELLYYFSKFRRRSWPWLSRRLRREDHLPHLPAMRHPGESKLTHYRNMTKKFCSFLDLPKSGGVISSGCPQLVSGRVFIFGFPLCIIR